METFQNAFDQVILFFEGYSIPATYVQAGAIIILVFLLIISLAQFRQHFVKWSLKGGVVGLFFGFLLTIILEGFLLVSGHTILTSTLGWTNAPKPFSTALDLGKEKLINVLGEKTEERKSQNIIEDLQFLSPVEIKKVKSIICTP